VAWGNNYYGQSTVPNPNSDFVSIKAGLHNLGLKSDGSIVAWGCNSGSDAGQCDVPSPNADFVGIAVGRHHSLGLKSDGSVVAWGSNQRSQLVVPQPNSGFISIAAGSNQSLAIRLRPGDFDGDGLVNADDLINFVDRLAGPGATPQLERWRFLDLDDDFDVDLADFRLMQNSYTGP